MRGRITTGAVLSALLLLSAGGPAARAASAPLAQVTAATTLAGGGGWLVWNAPVPGGWTLMGLHEGRTVQLPSGVRRQPFDVSVGSGTHGEPVAIFSRCARPPSVRTTGEQGGHGGAIVEPQTGRGCRVAVLALATGRLSAPPIPAPRGVSDTTPSIWRGTITFARHDPVHGDVWQVVSWSPSRPRRLSTLPHGRIPSCPERRHGCRSRAEATVGALSSDGSVVAFLWELPFGEEGLTGEGAWEVRVDRVRGSSGTLAAGDFGHEACTDDGQGAHELEYVWPEPPIAEGSVALYGELDAFSCFHGFASVLNTHGAARGHAREGKLEAVALALAEDEGHLYGLVPRPATASAGGDSPGCSAAAPCAIEQLASPALRLDPQSPFVPFR